MENYMRTQWYLETKTIKEFLDSNSEQNLICAMNQRKKK